MKLARPVRVSWAALALVLAATTRQAHADPAHAAEAYHTAEDAFVHHAYRAAAESFERAFHEDPHGASIYNAGVSWEAAREPARAADDYDRALAATDLGTTQRNDARSRLATLVKQLGQLEATGPQGVTISVAHAEGLSLPARVHLAPGQYPVRASLSNGRVESRAVTIVSGQTATLDWTPPPAEVPVVVAPPPQPVHTSSGLRTGAWVSVGSAAVLSAVAIGLGVATTNTVSTFENGGDKSQSEHDEATALRAATNVAWALAGVAAVTGVTLFVVSIRGPRDPHEVGLAATMNGVSLTGRF